MNVKYVILLARGEEDPFWFNEILPPVLCADKAGAEEALSRLLNNKEVDWNLFEVVDGKCVRRAVSFGNGPARIVDNSAPARLDADGTAKPLTEIVAKVPRGHCVGPASYGGATLLFRDGPGATLAVPEQEDRRCAVYRDPSSSESSEEYLLLSEALTASPGPGAAIVSGSRLLATSSKQDHWELTTHGQERLGWEASLLKERWRRSGAEPDTGGRR